MSTMFFLLVWTLNSLKPAEMCLSCFRCLHPFHVDIIILSSIVKVGYKQLILHD